MLVKICHKCGSQARCSDSRQCNGYVRRRYICKCGERWTTLETRGDFDGRDSLRWRHFRDRMNDSQRLRMLAVGTAGYDKRIDTFIRRVTESESGKL